MSRRWIIAWSVLAFLIIGVELAVRLFVPKSARVEVVNESGETIEDLAVIYRGTRIALGNLGAGEFSTAWITATGPGTVELDFHQKENGMRGLQIGDYGLSKDVRAGLKLVIVVRKNQVERYMDDDERQPWEKIVDRIEQWLVGGSDRGAGDSIVRPAIMQPAITQPDKP